MRRPLLGLLLASTLLSSRPVLAEPPAPAAPAPTAPAPTAPAPLASPAPAPPSYAPPPAPAPWAAPLAVTRRRSTGALVGGIILSSLGALGMGVGTAIYVTAASDCSSSFDLEFGRSGCLRSASQDKLVGMTVLLSSAAVTALGVPLWIYGAQKVVAPPDEQPAMGRVSVRIGPTSASLQLSF